MHDTNEHPPTEAERQARLHLAMLALSVGAVSICGIIYQLIVGTVSTYLLGNSTYQFSMTIGLFMSAYGLGAFLSTRIQSRLLDYFVLTEILIGLVGGLSALILFYLYASSGVFVVGRVLLILVLGTLVGLEIPLLIRIAEDMRKNLRMTVGEMMGFDYLGALLGGVGFPLVLLPVWGLMGASFLVGLFNTIVAAAVLVVFRRYLVWRPLLWGVGGLAAVVLTAALFWARPLEHFVERQLYQDSLVYLEQTPYQKIVLTRRGEDLRLFLDGSLQFSARDEYRYHESLVHPAATRLTRLDRVLVLGGGDGLALRELLRHEGVGQVTLVDLDPAMTRLGREHTALATLNDRAFERLALDVRNEDAFNYVQTLGQEIAGGAAAPFDLVLVDLPDPHHESLAKLYSVTFYASLAGVLAPDGLIAAQIGSPFFANRSYWAAVRTFEAAGFNVRPYHVNVPSFGEWGFVLAARGPIPDAPARPLRARFYDTAADAHLFYIPADLEPRHDVEPNTLLRPVIVEYFQKDWRSWN